jgi:hypothetical protein
VAEVLMRLVLGAEKALALGVEETAVGAAVEGAAVEGAGAVVGVDAGAGVLPLPPPLTVTGLMRRSRRSARVHSTPPMKTLPPGGNR